MGIPQNLVRLLHKAAKMIGCTAERQRQLHGGQRWQHFAKQHGIFKRKLARKRYYGASCHKK